jgi:hypothetical protein
LRALSVLAARSILRCSTEFKGRSSGKGEERDEEEVLSLATSSSFSAPSAAARSEIKGREKEEG